MTSSSSSSEVDSVNPSNMVMEETTRWSISRYANEYYLMINGSRAQSKRSGTEFQRLASMTRQGDVMEVSAEIYIYIYIYGPLIILFLPRKIFISILYRSSIYTIVYVYI